MPQKRWIYSVGELNGQKAKRYNGEACVWLPDGTQLLCESTQAAETLKEVLNLTVKEQRHD
jgi:hypothetical protein